MKRSLSGLTLATAIAAALVLGAPGAARASATVPTLETAPRPAQSFPMNRQSPEYKDLRHMVEGHPNEIARMDALEAYGQGRFEYALSRFETAAKFGDKYSMHRLSLMYWYGDGASVDPVQAYIWADLAAERDYPALLVVRDDIWAHLDEKQRADAVKRGQAYYSRFGDEVAKPRMEAALKKNRSSMTGSRAGFDTGAQVTFVGDDAFNIGTALSSGHGGGEYWADYRWEPKLYWKIEDGFFGKGTVKIGELKKIDESTPKPEE